MIVRAIGSYYSVRTAEGETFQCRARGRLKKDGISPAVGDRVEFTVHSGTEGVLETVAERDTYLARPPVANVDQVVIVCAPQNPPLSLQLLDRLLVLAENRNLCALICLNKDDLPHDKEEEYLHTLYGRAGYKLLVTSAKLGRGISELQRELCDRVSVLAGPSGVGKSSLLNRIQPGLRLRTGEISEKLKRGKHTTRHVELLSLDCGGLVADTPGFSQLDLTDVKREDLPLCFPEFVQIAHHCRFAGCMHKSEPDCAVKEAVASGEVAKSRYEHYLVFLEEVTAQERSY
ncbi:MAG: ribosome small subunit-dependent GTPase A [Bacillota bacterium]|nr:ribosome small subunit-dependent GTPase A [Bacillota bacterium]MDW7682580.1 ribosome small subunit-dependent GTPase A [Bacillota bacterium]